MSNESWEFKGTKYRLVLREERTLFTAEYLLPPEYALFLQSRKRFLGIIPYWADFHREELPELPTAEDFWNYIGVKSWLSKLCLDTMKMPKLVPEDGIKFVRC